MLWFRAVMLSNTSLSLLVSVFVTALYPTLHRLIGCNCANVSRWGLGTRATIVSLTTPCVRLPVSRNLKTKLQTESPTTSHRFVGFWTLFLCGVKAQSMRAHLPHLFKWRGVRLGKKGMCSFREKYCSKKRERGGEEKPL